MEGSGFPGWAGDANPRSEEGSGAGITFPAAIPTGRDSKLGETQEEIQAPRVNLATGLGDLSPALARRRNSKHRRSCSVVSENDPHRHQAKESEEVPRGLLEIQQKQAENSLRVSHRHQQEEVEKVAHDSNRYSRDGGENELGESRRYEQEGGAEADEFVAQGSSAPLTVSPQESPPKKFGFLSAVLTSKYLLKDADPKTQLPSGQWRRTISESSLELNVAEVSVARVPSYKSASVSDRGIEKHFEPERRRITILSMDGGGMRGLMAARCLAHLESLLQAKTGEQVKLCDYFDFLAGTSTGAILTMMISTPDEKGDPLFTGKECCEFYARNGKNIFRPRWFDPWKGALRQLYRPKYSPRKFEKLLKGYLVRDGKALTMRDTLRPFLVTSFDISRATPHIFVRQAAMKDDSRNFRLWEVCRGTASAPTYFRPAEISSMDGKVTATLVDGGCIQNNPSLVAMTHVLGNNEEFPEAAGLQDVMILSLGAGQLDERFDLEKARKWGMAGWARPLLNIMMDGSSDTIDYQLAASFAGHNCAENYLRIQLSGLPNKTALMDCATPENVKDLIQCTDQLLQERAVMRNEYGEKIIHAETYAERLSWFADQLIIQKKLRDNASGPKAAHLLHNPAAGLGPTGSVLSPMYGHLFMHQQLHHNDLSKPLETAKSVRF